MLEFAPIGNKLFHLIGTCREVQLVIIIITMIIIIINVAVVAIIICVISRPINSDLKLL